MYTQEKYDNPMFQVFRNIIRNATGEITQAQRDQLTALEALRSKMTYSAHETLVLVPESYLLKKYRK